MDKISIIIPCFNEEEALPIYYTEMKKVMDTMKKQTDYTERTEDASIFPFPETLEKKRLFMQDFRMQAVIMRQLWMWICRIRRHFCRRCTEF